MQTIQLNGLISTLMVGIVNENKLKMKESITICKAFDAFIDDCLLGEDPLCCTSDWIHSRILLGPSAEDASEVISS